MASFQKVKIAITSVLLVVGLIFLGVGYSASSRESSKLAQLHDRISTIEKVAREQHESEQTIQEKQMVQDLTDTIEEQVCATRGAIQYCTGWLMIAAAGIVFSLGRNEKLFQPTV